MEVWSIHDYRRSEIFTVREDVRHSMTSFTGERCSIFNSLSIFHFENVVVEIENIVFGQGIVVRLSNKVVPYFNNIVAEVDMTIYKGIIS